MSFQAGDQVYVEVCSAASMIYYGEHKTEFGCPCKWRRMNGIVTHEHGNYVHVHELGNANNKTAFHFRDLRPVETGVET